MVNKNKSLFKEIGGIRIGNSYWISSNYTWTLAKLKVHKDKIIINYRFNKLIFNKNEIIGLKKYKSLFGFLGAAGIRIYHKKSKAPKFIVFWSLYPDKTINELKKRGYNLMKNEK